jgi:polyphosphate kinase 2 (PPK2 family)
MSEQTDNGRAFEWAVGEALAEQTGFEIVENSFSANAQAAYASQKESKQQSFARTAKVAIRQILSKEKPLLVGEGRIVFNSDAAGKKGDVRDVLLHVGDKTIGIFM